MDASPSSPQVAGLLNKAIFPLQQRKKKKEINCHPLFPPPRNGIQNRGDGGDKNKHLLSTYYRPGIVLRVDISLLLHLILTDTTMREV